MNRADQLEMQPTVYVRPTPKRRYIHIGWRCARCRCAVDLRTTDPESEHASLVFEMAREHVCD